MTKLQTKESYHRRVARVIEVILADPAASHSIESLAKVAGLSPFHFHRIFTSISGEGVAKTVQRIRLARAARSLLTPLRPVTDVALDAGYQSPQAFARAFKDFTDTTPTQFQALNSRMKDLDGTDDKLLVDFVTLAPFEIFALSHGGAVSTIAHTFRDLRQMVLADGVPKKYPAYVGVSSGDPENDYDFKYWIGTTEPKHARKFPTLTALKIDGGLYARYRLIGRYTLIDPAFCMLFGNWLPDSAYEADDRPALEFYHPHKIGTKKTEPVTDLLIPVKKAQI
jgi:AraC family transcriptional regulator